MGAERRSFLQSLIGEIGDFEHRGDRLRQGQEFGCSLGVDLGVSPMNREIPHGVQATKGSVLNFRNDFGLKGMFQKRVGRVVGG